AGDDITVMDFGIARSTDVAGFTQTGALIGTPAYMSPEQARGERVDQRSDLFSCGVIFYELLTGARPFDAATAAGMLMKRLQEDAVPPVEINASVPATLNNLVVKSLARDPAHRYQSAPQMLEDIEAWLHPSVQTTADLRSPRTWRR